MSKVLASSPFIETNITCNETKENSYLFNVTAFDPTYNYAFDGILPYSYHKTN